MFVSLLCHTVYLSVGVRETDKHTDRQINSMTDGRLTNIHGETDKHTDRQINSMTDSRLTNVSPCMFVSLLCHTVYLSVGVFVSLSVYVC